MRRVSSLVAALAAFLLATHVDDLKGILRQNRLEDADDAYLRDMAVIHIVAAEEKAR